MKKAIAILLIIVAAFLGTLLYFHAHDTRTADSLSAYARIEFTGLRGSDGSATSAHFTVWDTRYDGAKADSKVTLVTDGKEWPLIASVKQKDAGSFQKENEISVFLPAATLDDIKKATTVRFRYSYKDGQTIDLPLNDADLAYWKGQVE